MKIGNQKEDWSSKKILGGKEELTLQVSYLIPFKCCFKGFSVVKISVTPFMYLALKLPRCESFPYVV